MIIAVLNAIKVIANRSVKKSGLQRGLNWGQTSVHMHSSQAHQNSQMTSSQRQWLHSSVG